MKNRALIRERLLIGFVRNNLYMYIRTMVTIIRNSRTFFVWKQKCNVN